MIKKEYKEIVKAAKAGGEVARKYFGKSLVIEGKTLPSDFRTKADLEAEKEILRILKKNFPEYNINSEEAGETDKNSEYTFIIDPIDGTNNFVLGVPYFSTGIALFKGDDIIFSVVYDPVLKNIYYAEKNKGAYLNGKKIHVNKEPDVKNSTVACIGNYNTPVDVSQKIIFNLKNNNVKRATTFWSVIQDICHLASGKIEAALIFDNLEPWDVAPGKLIAREAGAMITDLSGNKVQDKDSISLLSYGTKIHTEILEILKK